MSSRTSHRDACTRREAMLERVRDLLVGSLRVRVAREDIQPDVALFGTGLCLDSVDAVELVVCLESELGLRIPDGDATTASLRTVGGIVELALTAAEGTR